jgi:gluconolactonase
VGRRLTPPQRAVKYGYPTLPEEPRVLQGVQKVAEGLRFPEGPVVMPDGSVIVVEMHGGAIQRIDPDGGVELVAECGGGPNGAALGPDGALYVCNNGGRWSDHYSGGRIQRVDLESGSVDDLYIDCEGVPLSAPNDLVFDRTGSFWFTDSGRTDGRQKELGRIMRAAPDGYTIEEAIASLDVPNGIGLSPDESTLYFSETLTGRLHRWAIPGPPQADDNCSRVTPSVLCGLPGVHLFDSLAVERSGAIAVATPISGCVTVVAADGGRIRQFWPPDDFDDPMLSNICFGPDGSGMAYITLSSRGWLVQCEWSTC